MTSRTVTIEFTQLVILLCLVAYTVWVWCKSFNCSSKNFSEEYIALHHKYTNLEKEHAKMQQFMSSFGNTKVKPIVNDDNDDDVDFDDYF